MTVHHTRQEALYQELVSAVRQVQLSEDDKQLLWWMAGHGPEMATTAASLLKRAAVESQPHVPAPRPAWSAAAEQAEQIAWRRWREDAGYGYTPRHASPAPDEAAQWRDLNAGVRALLGMGRPAEGDGNA